MPGLLLKIRWLLFSLPLLSATVHTAEPETLLRIEGDRIGRIAALPDDTDPVILISRYYELLPEPLQIQVANLRADLVDLVPLYEVAYDAADSAEITELRSDIYNVWARIRTIHARQFTGEIAELLDRAYRSLYAPILSPQ